MLRQDVSEDLSHSDTRLSVQLYGFELHTYNRSGLYTHLEEKFGLEPGIVPQEDDPGGAGDKEADTADPDMDSTEYVLGKNWRDLIPVIKVGWVLIFVENGFHNLMSRLTSPLASSSSATVCC